MITQINTTFFIEDAQADMLVETEYVIFKTENLSDQMKLEYLSTILNKFSQEQLEIRLK